MSDIDAFNIDADHHGKHHGAVAPDGDSDDSQINTSESAHEEAEHDHHEKENEI